MQGLIKTYEYVDIFLSVLIFPVTLLDVCSKILAWFS
jgi:hypothetical protein